VIKGMTMRKTITIVITAVVGVGAGMGVASLENKPKPTPVCVAGPNELCPSDQFLYDTQHLKEMKQDLAKRAQSSEVRTFQDEVDTAGGLQQRLVNEINATKGCGPAIGNVQAPCEWSDAKGKFIPLQGVQVSPIPEVKK